MHSKARLTPSTVHVVRNPSALVFAAVSGSPCHEVL
jgi:hypothetical protein